MGVSKTLNERIFRQIHGKSLVYNTCWEDPRCDRKMLQMDPDSRVVVLTSAGCNALDYLLDGPAEVHCVDVNPRQNALLQLKKACFENGEQGLLESLFGAGFCPNAEAVFSQKLNKFLSPEAQNYWQQHLDYFSGKGLRPSFYWRGSSGAIAWMVRQWLFRNPETRRIAENLFQSQTLEEQTHWYTLFEPRFLNPFLRWFLKQHMVQSMLGVPKSQQRLATTLYPDGMAGYIRNCLRQVFTRLPISDNYFWQLYYHGKYSETCRPNYLRPEHFETLRNRANRIQTYTDTLSGFLLKNPKTYTHFILLDHQDWLAANQKEALIEEWALILKHAAPGAKVLLRSAAQTPDFIPDFVNQQIDWNPEAAQQSQETDRVGTYAGTLIGTISASTTH